MKLKPVIENLRQYCPRFQGRVGGSALLESLEECDKYPVPSAYVLPSDDIVGEQRSQTDYWQTLTEGFSIVVALDNEYDERGRVEDVDAIDNIRTEIFRALLGWEPDEGCGSISYAGGHLLDIDRYSLHYQFDFKRENEINFEDTRQYTDLNNLHDLHTVAIDVDNNEHVEINLNDRH